MQDSLPRPQRTIFACLPHPSFCIESQVWSPLLFCMFPLVPAPKLCIVLAHNPLFLAFIFAGYIPLACMPITSLSWAKTILQDLVHMLPPLCNFSWSCFLTGRESKSNVFLLRIWIAHSGLPIFMSFIWSLWHCTLIGSYLPRTRSLS